MNEETRKKYEGCFIPCGDSMEMMDQMDVGVPASADEKEKTDAENPEVNG